MGFTSFIFTKNTVMRHFSFRKINGLYVSLAPRAKPEGIFRVWGMPSATADKPIIYTIDYTLAKAAMSVPDVPIRMGYRWVFPFLNVAGRVPTKSGFRGGRARESRSVNGFRGRPKTFKNGLCGSLAD